MPYRAYVLNSSKAVVAVLGDATWEYTETLNASDSIRLQCAELDKFTYLQANESFVRLVNDADSTDKRTYRIQSVDDVHEAGNVGVRIEGDRIWQDMGQEAYAGYHPYRGATVATLVTDILTHSAFQIKSGGAAQSDTTAIESIDLSYLTVLDALQRVAEEAQLEIEIDESTSPESIDLKTRGSDAGLRLQYAGNVPSVTRSEDRTGVINKVYPVGGGVPPATCKFARFEILTWSDPTLTVKGDKCVPVNDSWNGYYIQPTTGTEAGNQLSVTDSVRGAAVDTDTLTVGGNPSLSAGDYFYFRTLGADGLDYLPDATSITSYGEREGMVHETSIEDVTTLVEPSYMDGTYAAGVAEGWINTGSATLSEETGATFVKHGTASQKVIAGAAAKGIAQTLAGLSETYYTFSANLYVTSGSVEVKVTGDDGETYLNGAGTSGTGWIRVDLEQLKIGGTGATLWIRSVGGAATFYVDAVAFTNSKAASQSFVQYNGARALYRLAFDKLERTRTAEIEYTVGDAANFTGNVGDTITVVDPEFSTAAEVRVLTIGKDQDGNYTAVSLASRTDTDAVFHSLAPAVADRIRTRRNEQQDAEDTKYNQSNAANAAWKIANHVPSSTQGRPYDGVLKALTQTSFSYSAGTIRIGDREAFTLGGATISGLAADTVFYVYFDKGDAASAVQTSTSILDAMGEGVIFITMIKTGATALDRVQIWQADQQTDGELHSRGLEVYDDSDVKRIDLGDLADLASAQNPSDWGLAITEGVMWQNCPSADAWTGGGIGVWRYLKAEMDLGTNQTAQMYADWVDVKAKATTVFMGRYTKVYATGTNGLATGALYWAISDGSGGDATGLNVTADGANTGMGINISAVNATAANAYALYIANGISAGGTGYTVYSAATERAYFASRLFSIGGINYTFPAADGGANEVLQTDGSLALSWVANAGGGIWAEVGNNVEWTSGHATLAGLILRYSGAGVALNLHADSTSFGFLDQDGDWIYKITNDSIHTWAIGNANQLLLTTGGIYVTGPDIRISYGGANQHRIGTGATTILDVYSADATIASIRLKATAGGVIGSFYGSTTSHGLLDNDGEWGYKITTDVSHIWYIDNVEKMSLTTTLLTNTAVEINQVYSAAGGSGTSRLKFDRTAHASCSDWSDIRYLYSAAPAWEALVIYHTDNTYGAIFETGGDVYLPGVVTVGSAAPASHDTKFEVWQTTAADWTANFYNAASGYGITVGNRSAVTTGIALHMGQSGGTYCFVSSYDYAGSAYLRLAVDGSSLTTISHDFYLDYGGIYEQRIYTSAAHVLLWRSNSATYALMGFNISTPTLMGYVGFQDLGSGKEFVIYDGSAQNVYVIREDTYHKWYLNNTLYMTLNATYLQIVGEDLYIDHGGSYTFRFNAYSTAYLKVISNNVGGGGLALANSSGTITGYVYGAAGGYIGFVDSGGVWAYYHIVNSFHAWFSNNVEKFRIAANGDVTGTHGTYHTSSDLRHKTNIRTADNALKLIGKLRGVWFDWRPGYGRHAEGARNLGLIAQEVEAYIPEVVHVARDTYAARSVYKEDLVALCINAINELKAQNDDLRAEVETLKAA